MSNYLLILVKGKNLKKYSLQINAPLEILTITKNSVNRCKSMFQFKIAAPATA